MAMSMGGYLGAKSEKYGPIYRSFLGMPDFLRRFGQFDRRTRAYHFSNVRAGLIVAMVSPSASSSFSCHSPDITQLSIGTLIGALVAAPIADRIGRRLSISFWCVIFTGKLSVVYRRNSSS
jgi:SP family sugar:H+ symporter-like MFS transporter